MTRRAAYFDCFSGISGDMALGALLDLGAPEESLRQVVVALGLGDEVALRIGKAQRGHLGGVRVEVDLGQGPARTLPELLALVGAATLDEGVKTRSLAAIERLGAAEAKLHGVDRAAVHLHELGGADTLIDIVGTFTLLDSLGVDDVYCSPLPAEVGRPGRVLPLPAPAALEVLAGTGATFLPVDSDVELVTPTGAVLMAVSARFERPVLRPAAFGYGAGGRDLPGNLLRVWLGEVVAGGPDPGGVSEGDVIVMLETNLDDMPGNALAALVEDLFEAGALDVTIGPVLMKKGRPGHALSVMSPLELQPALTRRLLGGSSTLGVRVSEVRRVLAGRSIIEVMTELGSARVKLKILDGEVVDAAPEYEDCRRLARESGRDLRDVMRMVAEAARPASGRP